jgi:hypothetical protein
MVFPLTVEIEYLIYMYLNIIKIILKIQDYLNKTY